MSKPGRNDPCYCGSGKKYKQCHLPIDEAARTEQRHRRQTMDTLLPKVIEASQGLPNDIPVAFERYWNGKYTAAQMSQIEELEDRGSERFLTWFAFDYPLDDGRTLTERLAAGDAEADLSDDERAMIQEWASIRLRPYIVAGIDKGKSITVRDMLDNGEYVIEDSAASRRIDPDEVLVAHLVPVGSQAFVAGAAAHLTADTADKLREFAGLHLEAYQRDNPDATWSDLLRVKSEVLNHFVMELPVEAPDPTLLENILMQTRASLQLAGESIGIGRSKTTTEQPAEAEQTTAE